MNAKQEILDLILDIDLDVEGRNVVGETVPHNTMRIRAILETHELVPIDTRPFDPTLCGFKRVDAGYVLAQSDSVSDVWVTPFDQTGLMDISCESGSWVCPWPATHAGGETLLRLLGVLG